MPISMMRKANSDKYKRLLTCAFLSVADTPLTSLPQQHVSSNVFSFFPHLLSQFPQKFQVSCSPKNQRCFFFFERKKEMLYISSHIVVEEGGREREWSHYLSISFDISFLFFDSNSVFSCSLRLALLFITTLVTLFVLIGLYNTSSSDL